MTFLTGIGMGFGFWLGMLPFVLLMRSRTEKINPELMAAWDRGNELHAEQNEILRAKHCDNCRRLRRDRDEAERQLRALADGVNRRCNAGPSELPLVSLDRELERLKTSVD